jgi:hypothetical protein
MTSALTPDPELEALARRRLCDLTADVQPTQDLRRRCLSTSENRSAVAKANHSNVRRWLVAAAAACVIAAATVMFARPSDRDAETVVDRPVTPLPTAAQPPAVISNPVRPDTTTPGGGGKFEVLPAPPEPFGLLLASADGHIVALDTELIDPNYVDAGVRITGRGFIFDQMRNEWRAVNGGGAPFADAMVVGGEAEGFELLGVARTPESVGPQNEWRWSVWLSDFDGDGAVIAKPIGDIGSLNSYLDPTPPLFRAPNSDGRLALIAAHASTAPDAPLIVHEVFADGLRPLGPIESGTESRLRPLAVGAGRDGNLFLLTQEIDDSRGVSPVVLFEQTDSGWARRSQLPFPEAFAVWSQDRFVLVTNQAIVDGVSRVESGLGLLDPYSGAVGLLDPYSGSFEVVSDASVPGCEGWPGLAVTLTGDVYVESCGQFGFVDVDAATWETVDRRLDDGRELEQLARDGAGPAVAVARRPGEFDPNDPVGFDPNARVVILG